ncbi:hypothetical protein [Variovorax sp. UC74_104]|uniref:hypothetical protein n=1 Tax=Variovorax sp. UC74_104 TaxID=3374555 RepID=UPI00375732FF
MGGLYTGRLWRIGPTYLLAVGLMFLVVGWRTGFELREPAWSVLGAVLQWLALGIWPLQPDINGYVGTTLILAGVTWTVFVEWLFYGALRPMAPLARGDRTPRFVIGGMLLVCLPLLVFAALSPGATPSRPTLALVIGALAWVLASFLMGMLSAWLVRREGPRLPQRAASLLALACLAGVFLGFEHMVGPVQVLLLWGFFPPGVHGQHALRPAGHARGPAHELGELQHLPAPGARADPGVRGAAGEGVRDVGADGLLAGGRGLRPAAGGGIGRELPAGREAGHRARTAPAVRRTPDARCAGRPAVNGGGLQDPKPSS